MKQILKHYFSQYFFGKYRVASLIKAGLQRCHQHPSNGTASEIDLESVILYPLNLEQFLAKNSLAPSSVF